MEPPKLYLYGTNTPGEKITCLLKLDCGIFRVETLNIFDMFMRLVTFKPNEAPHFAVVGYIGVLDIWYKSTHTDITELRATLQEMPIPEEILKYLETL